MTFSWGLCDSSLPAAFRQAVERSLAARSRARDHGLRLERRQRLLRLPAAELLEPRPERRLPVGSAAGRLGGRDAALGRVQRELLQRVGMGEPALGRRRRRRDQHPRRRSELAAGGEPPGRRPSGAAGRLGQRQPGERMDRPRLRELGLVRRHERRLAVLGRLDAACGAVRLRSTVSSAAASSRRSCTASRRAISPTRRSTTSGWAATASTAPSAAGTSPPASAHLTSTTSPATSPRTSARTPAGPRV